MSFDLDRINELARKSKKEGLSEEEKKEQEILRREYIENFKANLRASLNNISLVDEDGTVTRLADKVKKK